MVSVAPAILNACAPPSEKVNVGLIGCQFDGVERFGISFLKDRKQCGMCWHLCDVDSKILEERATEVEKQHRKKTNYLC
jgi:hypothetical protein